MVFLTNFGVGTSIPSKGHNILSFLARKRRKNEKRETILRRTTVSKLNKKTKETLTKKTPKISHNFY